jgi:tetratricopeptide (TPR) repeat protein
MSEDDLEAVTAAYMMCCASCGVAEVDDIKLKKCDDCDLVKYCSDKCQQEHRPKHEAMCKKRAAELRDEILFRQPESSDLGDCPICFLPLPIYTDSEKSVLMTCCIKIICKGCHYANALRELKERLEQTCPFCRHPVPTTKEEMETNKMKRVAANDPVAIREVGVKRYYEGDYDSAFEYFTRAAGLGDVDAHHSLSVMYHEGQGVDKDEKKELYHLEEAAIAGNLFARYNLALIEGRNGRFDRAVKHFIIAANLGCDTSIQMLKEGYTGGLVSKEEFAAALRAHQAAVDATKSPQREAAAKFMTARAMR